MLIGLFMKLNTLLQEVQCFVDSPKCAEGSVLLEEVTACRNVEDVSESFVDTPVLHNLACINSLLTLCVHLSRTNQVLWSNCIYIKYPQNLFKPGTHCVPSVPGFLKLFLCRYVCVYAPKPINN